MTFKKILSRLLFFLVLLISVVLCVTACTGSGTGGKSTDDGKHAVSYICDTEMGSIEGKTEQSVEDGKSASSVKAVPKGGYVFVKWSDGVTTPERTDEKVECDISVKAIFSPENYTVTYKGYFGSEELFSETVTKRYDEKITFDCLKYGGENVFKGWNDGGTRTKRTDDYTAHGRTFIAKYDEKTQAVPIIRIDTRDKAPIDSKENYLDCNVNVEKAGIDHNISNAAARVRGRGNVSWNASPSAKNSYRLKFDEKTAMFGSDYKDKDWCLISNVYDQSMARNYIAYELSERMENIGFTTMHKYVELYINDEYKGLYMLCDQMETGKGRIDIDEDLSDPENIAFFLERDLRADDPNEGYLHNFDYFYLPSTDHYADGVDSGVPYQIRTPDPKDPSYDPAVHLDYVLYYMYDSMVSIIDKDWAKVNEMIDVENFAEMFIVQDVLLNLDVGWHGFYFYKDKGGKLCMGPVWDFDFSMGNAEAFGWTDDGISVEDMAKEECYASIDYDNFEQSWACRKNPWFRRLMRIPEFVEIVKEKLDYYDKDIKEVLECVNPNSSQFLYKKYKTYFDKNYDKWQVLGHHIMVNPDAIARLNTAEEHMEYIYKWVNERLGVIREFYGLPKEKTS